LIKKSLSILSIISILLCWHALSSYKLIDAEFFPSPFVVLNRLAFLIKDADFLLNIKESFQRLLFGTLISVPLALLISLACSLSKSIDKILNPFIAFTFPLPKVAIMPLLMLMFGIGDSFKIAIISLGMFYLLFINLRSSMIFLINSPLADVAKIYDISGMDYFYHVLLKGVFLNFLIGLQTALGYGLTLVVVSEFSMSKNGIGNFIWKSWDQFKIIDMYAGIYFLCFLGFALYTIMDTLIMRQSQKYNQ
jgi:ABC-type nitrate/sulfonate/bicarbonate transport system permease component